jgi:uncharacterized membrane protein
MRFAHHDFVRIGWICSIRTSPWASSAFPATPHICGVCPRRPLIPYHHPVSDKLEEPDASRGPIRISMGARLRGYFFAGVLVTAPLAITIYIAWLLISFVDERVFSVIPPVYNPETYLPFSIPGIGLILMVLVLTLVGALTAGYLGKLLLRFSDRLLNRMPVIRNIYGTAKQIVETVINNKTSAFHEAVLVEYPRRDIWTIGFITGRSIEEVAQVGGQSLVNVFVPTTPNPTSGFLLFLPEKDLHRLPMTVEEAIKLIISGGIVTPPARPQTNTPPRVLSRAG